MHNMDVLIKLPGIVSGNRSSIIYKIAFWISTLESLVLTEHNKHIRHIKFFIIYQHICTLNEEPTDPGKSLLSLPIKPFFTWNFLSHLKQTVLQINLFLAWKHRARLNSATIDWFVENWAACSLPSALRLTYCQISYTWLACSLDHKHKGKGI